MQSYPKDIFWGCRVCFLVLYLSVGGSAGVGGTFQWLDFLELEGDRVPDTKSFRYPPFRNIIQRIWKHRNVLQDGMREADFLRPDGMWLGP